MFATPKQFASSEFKVLSYSLTVIFRFFGNLKNLKL
jgi:hypothetical protein